jgi:transcriptional regulator with XRE-family HTH domain
LKALKDLAETLGETPRAQREREVQAQVLEIGTALREARLKKNWSQSDLAEYSDVAQPEISRIENGTFQQGPTAVTLCRLALALSARISLAPLDAEPLQAEADSATPDLENEDSHVNHIRDEIRKEIAALLHPLRQRDRLILSDDGGEVEVRLVPIMTKYLNKKVHSDLEKLAEDVGLSIEQTKLGVK